MFALVDGGIAAFLQRLPFVNHFPQFIEEPTFLRIERAKGNPQER